jgi:phage terminase Nu1 subunit (DNA packaging protein)
MAYQEDDLLTSAELAEALKVNERTVRRWRNEGTGPPVMWAGGLARYRWGDVLAWMRRRQEGEGADESEETDEE